MHQRPCNSMRSWIVTESREMETAPEMVAA